jgi:chaperonin GroES
MGFNLELNGNRVALSLDEVGDQTAGGLYVPQSVAQEGPKKGKVVAVSESYLVNGAVVTSKFKPGDAVLVDALGGAKITVDRREFLVVRNEDILGRYLPEVAE